LPGSTSTANSNVPPRLATVSAEAAQQGDAEVAARAVSAMATARNDGAVGRLGIGSAR
jgi:hypothetical protein